MSTPKKAPTGLPSLGQSQVNLENATKEIKAAQKNFQSAAIRLHNAEESYQTAMTTLNADIQALKSSARVVPLNAQ